MAVDGTLRVAGDRVFFEFGGRTVSAPVPAGRHGLDALGQLHRGREVGRALGEAYAGGDVAGALIAAVAAGPVRIGLVVPDQGLPWESLVVPGLDVPLARHPGVELYRRIGDGNGAGGPWPPGPLRILAVPDDRGPDDRSPDDRSPDLELAVVQALEPVQRTGRARLRFPRAGTVAAIADALREERFHVLHLAGRVSSGELVLDARIPAAVLVAAIPDGRLPTLVVLSGPAGDLGSVAEALAAAGVPQVIAIADVHARLFYRELAAADRPDPLAALAAARRKTAESAEWILFARGVPGLLHDGAAGGEEPEPDTAFVGRRRDLRLLTAALQAGDSAGVVIHGLGGVGKSSLAAELLRRDPLPGAPVVTVTGVTTPAEILDAVGAAVDLPGLRDPALPWQSRLRLLRTGFLGAYPLVLLFDGAEANLTGDDTSFTDFLTAWAGDPGRGRLVVTSRQPLPVTGPLTGHHLGPLSATESLLLMGRLPALNRFSARLKLRAYELAGGHPRALEYLDALLRSGRARYPAVEARIRRRLRERGVGDPAAGNVAAAAAGDFLLGPLLGVLTPSALGVLVKAAVFTAAADPLALSWQDDPGWDGDVRDLMEELLADDFDPAAVPRQCARSADPEFRGDLATLAGLGLLTALTGTVHPWTASALALRYPVQTRAAHAEAAHYFLHQFAAQRKLAPESEAGTGSLELARRHFHQAGAVDSAVFTMYLLMKRLVTARRWDMLHGICRQTLQWLTGVDTDEARWHRATCLQQMAQIDELRGEPESARALITEAIQLIESGPDQRQLDTARQVLGTIEETLATGPADPDPGARFAHAEDLFQQGKFADSLAAFRELVETAEALGDPRQTATIRFWIAQLEVRLGNEAEAIRQGALGLLTFAEPAEQVTAETVRLLRRMRFQVGSLRFDRYLPALPGEVAALLG